MTLLVDPVAAHEVAAAYADTPTQRHPLVTAAYVQLAVESDLVYRQVTDPDRPGSVRVVFTTCPNPYDDAGELIRSVRDDRVLEVVTVAADRDRRHPLLGCDAGGAYDRFRAVHDIVGHARLRLGFDRHSEFTVWRSQVRWHSPLAGWALATELHGQHSVLWTTGQLAEPKAILLDPRLLRRSVSRAHPTTPTTPHPTGERPIMKLVVIGGTGLIGSKVVTLLGEHGHEAIAAAPQTGVNSLTGEGLPEALAGADVVVDVTNSPSFEDSAVMEFFQTSTRNLLEAEGNAGVGHHVALSIVGVDRPSDIGYFRAKRAQEELIEQSSIPYSIVHATQFLEFLGRIADEATVDGEVRLPHVLFQPMAADEVAAAVARTAAGPPLNGMVEVAGADQGRFDDIVRRYLEFHGDPRPVVADPHAHYFGAEIAERTLVPGDGAQLGDIRYEDWLAKS